MVHFVVVAVFIVVCLFVFLTDAYLFFNWFNPILFMHRKHTFKKERGRAAQNQYAYVSVTYKTENSIYKGKSGI